MHEENFFYLSSPDKKSWTPTQCSAFLAQCHWKHLCVLRTDLFKRNTCRAPEETWIETFGLCQGGEWKPRNLGVIIPTEFIIPPLDRGLSVHVITCNTVWQIPKSRCPSILSACAAPREVCSHEAKGVSRIAHTSTTTITSPDWFWRAKKSSFNDIVHLSHWLKVGGWWGGGSGKGVG